MARDFITNLLMTEAEVIQLLAEIPNNDPNAASDFFARFGFGPLYQQSRFYEALDRGHEILHLVAKLDPKKYEQIHKGCPFYWMGMAAYRIHDYQTAIYYIDATLSEDNRNFPGDSNTPPHLFLRLEGEDGRQAAQDIVKGVQQTIEEYISLYNQVIVKNPINIQQYSIDDLRKSFLHPSTLSREPAKRSLSTALITFFLEFKYRDFQLSLIKVPGTNEPFYMHLFKGCLIFESLLKNNTKTVITGRTLFKVLLELREDLLLDPQSKLDLSADTAEEALNLAISGNDELTSHVIVTGKLRNTLSHNLGWPSEITRQQYLHAFLQVAISCIHVLATLYRK